MTETFRIFSKIASSRRQDAPQQALSTKASRGFFSYARNFSIGRALMIEQVTINEQEPSAALSWLCIHTMQGVEYHSHERDPPPRCHEGTRSELITMVQDWLSSANSKQRLLWLRGPPGVGKSAIAQSLAELEKACKGATVFFSWSPPFSANSHPCGAEPSRVWTTISYRLATNEPSYLDYVQREIRRDPKLVEQSMEHQFRVLITEPIGRKRLIKPRTSPHFTPIILDGLDQFCDPDLQERIIRLIFDFICAYPEAPLVWILTSRPERHLAQMFDDCRRLGESFNVVSIGVHTEDSRRDVQTFLKSQFKAIQRRYEVVEPSPWPIENDFSRLLVAVSGLFVFACAVACFVGDREVANPVGQFNVVLPLITSTSSNTPLPENANPLDSVHKIYMRILQRVSTKDYCITRRILGFFLLPSGFGHWARDSTPFWALCNILNIDQHTAYASLSKLHSLLEIPRHHNATSSPVRFFHPSFADYLTNRSASKDFWIDTREVIADIWQCHFRALQETYTTDHLTPQPSNIRLAWPSSPEENREFQNDFWENARRAFFHHLLPCPPNRCAFGIHYDDLSNTENPTKLIDVLREMHFNRLVECYVFPDVPYRFLAFLDWLVQDGHTLLEEHGLLRELELTGPERLAWLNNKEPSFKVQVVHSDDGGCINEFTAYTDLVLANPDQIDPSRLFSTGERPLPLSQLQSDLMEHRDGFAIAFVVGSEMAGQCVLLMDASQEHHTFYYMLPYKTVG